MLALGLGPHVGSFNYRGFGVDAEGLEAYSEETQTGGTVCFLCALSGCFIVQRLELEEVGTKQAGHLSQVGRATGSSGVHSA